VTVIAPTSKKPPPIKPISASNVEIKGHTTDSSINRRHDDERLPPAHSIAIVATCVLPAPVGRTTTPHRSFARHASIEAFDTGAVATWKFLLESELVVSFRKVFVSGFGADKFFDNLSIFVSGRAECLSFVPDKSLRHESISFAPSKIKVPLRI
jgi:hypothetical protein